VRRFDKKDDEDDDPMLTALLVKRARLVASAANKMDALQTLMEKKRTDSHMLVYCGDGTIDDPTSLEDQRQVDAVCKLLGRDMGIMVAPFVAETNAEEREELIKELDNSSLQALVAIRCLDEGVDIPAIRTAIIIASSRNPRQFIQRRGRILRRAEIYDMVTTPPHDIEILEPMKKLMRKEIERFAEFADLALNSGEASLVIQEFKEKYHI
jgi:superfamily II DNA or RNA helicase